MEKRSYIVLLIVLLAACRNEADLPDTSALYPVRFSLPEITSVTRAVNGDLTDLAADTKLTVAAYNPNTKAFIAQSQYKVNPAGTGLVLDNSSDMFLSAGTYDFCAIVPGQTLTGEGRLGRIAKGVDALGSTTRAQMRAEATVVTLENLRHLASQVSFTARVVKENSPITIFKIVQITIDSMVVYTDDQGELVMDNYRLPENELIIPALNDENRYGKISIVNSGDDKFTYQEEAPAGKSGKLYNIQKEPLIVFPRANKSFKATIQIKIKEGNSAEEEKTVYAKINHLAFEPGKRYLFEVNYGWDFVNFAVTVSPWTTVENDQGQVGSGEQEVSTSYSVDEWGDLVELGGDLGGA